MEERINQRIKGLLYRIDLTIEMLEEDSQKPYLYTCCQMTWSRIYQMFDELTALLSIRDNKGPIY